MIFPLNALQQFVVQGFPNLDGVFVFNTFYVDQY